MPQRRRGDLDHMQRVGSLGMGEEPGIDWDRHHCQVGLALLPLPQIQRRHELQFEARQPRADVAVSLQRSPEGGGQALHRRRVA
jgi:hypothetical protein